MQKDKNYWDRYNKYLKSLALLNVVKKEKLITDNEYMEMKRGFLNDYQVQDYA